MGGFLPSRSHNEANRSFSFIERPLSFLVEDVTKHGEEEGEGFAGAWFEWVGGWVGGWVRRRRLE